MAFLTTPNSITGQLISGDEKIARIALSKKRFFVIDEAFIDFVEGESVKQLIGGNPYVIILRSLTKYYALPGLRLLGYLLARSSNSRTIGRLFRTLVRQQPPRRSRWLAWPTRASG